MSNTYTRPQIRARMQARKELVFLGQTDATAADATRIRDGIRLGQATRDSGYFGEAFLRILGSAADGASDPQYAGKVSYLDPASGDLFTSPNTALAVQAGKSYEIWKNGIEPDDVDRAIDRALVEKCRVWRMKPLSMLSDVESWTSKLGLTTLTPTALSFPTEYFEKSLLVDDNGTATGGAISENYYVQPNQSIAIFGFCMVRVGSANVLLYDATAGATAFLSPTLTLRGPQFFCYQTAVPAGCGVLQLRLKGVGANDIVEWAGVGMIASNASEFILPARVRSEEEVGYIYGVGPNLTSIDFLKRFQVYNAHREKAGGSVRVWFDAPPAPGFGLYYEELSHYAPFCPYPGMTALAPTSEFFTQAGRILAEVPATDCDLRYVEAASVVELLKDRQDNPNLARIFAQARTDLDAAEAAYGPEQKIIREHTRTPSVRATVRRV